MDGFSTRADVRRQLLARRASFPGRNRAESLLAERVLAWLEASRALSLGFYWPYRGEPDLRPVVAQWLSNDSRRMAALPVIVDGTMSFLSWQPDSEMRAGAYGIAVPAAGETVAPAVLIIPCVGFDARGYRLGYGGGWYDKTLARLEKRPRTVGVAFEVCRLDSIHPEAHDIALDRVLTESAAYPTAAPDVAG